MRGSGWLPTRHKYLIFINKVNQSELLKDTQLGWLTKIVQRTKYPYISIMPNYQLIFPFLG